MTRRVACGSSRATKVARAIERWHHRHMSRKPPPKSKLERPRPLAYARRQKTGSEATADDDKQGGMPIGEQLAALAKPEEAESAAMKSDNDQVKDEPAKDAAKAKDEAKKPDAGAPDAAKPDDDVARSKRTTETPVDELATDPWRSRADTQLMPPLAKVGAPPEVPAAAPAMPKPAGAVEDPTFMPGPRDVPAGDPNDPASPPGRVPRGDSRSLRRANEFALIYRVGTFVISRFGTIGTRGQWRVVEYPTSTSASHAYAKESSRFVSEGFSDYRDY
jgi:hypothetical protein